MLRSCRIVGFMATATISLALMTPSLAVAVGSTPVTVVNALDIAKAQGIQTPFQAQIQCYGGGYLCEGSISVPSNQRWVIEHVSASCSIEGKRQQLGYAWVETVLNGAGLHHSLAIPDHVGVLADGGSGPLVYQVELGQMVRLYADPGTRLAVLVSFSAAPLVIDPSLYPFCNFAFTGQAINVP